MLAPLLTTRLFHSLMIVCRSARVTSPASPLPFKLNTGAIALYVSDSVISCSIFSALKFKSITLSCSIPACDGCKKSRYLCMILFSVSFSYLVLKILLVYSSMYRKSPNLVIVPFSATFPLLPIHGSTTPILK